MKSEAVHFSFPPLHDLAMHIYPIQLRSGKILDNMHILPQNAKKDSWRLLNFDVE